jgi:hypothetical protein
MKALNAGVIATVTVALSTLVCSQAAAQCPSPPADPTTKQTFTFPVTLINGATPGSCVASNIKPNNRGYTIRTSNKGDTINWIITNNCSVNVTFGISDFRPMVPPLTATSPIDQPLVETPSSLSVPVSTGGGVGLLTVHIKPSPTLNHHGRGCTQYVYDFEDIISGTPTPPRKKIADPQIEIPN